MTEIGTFTSGKSPTALRILGPSYTKPAFIELVAESFSPVSDSLGNLRLLIDSADDTSAFDYTAFGEPQTACECPWNYAASRYDPQTGLYYNLSRYYDPLVKRWLSGDTAGFVDSMNLYAYVLNNPCRYIDPQGKFVFMIPILIFGGEITAALICDALITSAIVGTLSFGAAHLENYANNSLSSPPPSFFEVQQSGYGNGFDLEVC